MSEPAEGGGPYRWLWLRTVMGQDPADASPAAIDAAAQLTASERLVAVAIGMHGMPSGERVRPGLARLVKETGLGSRTVQRARARIEELGLVEVVERGGRERGPRSTEYALTAPDMPRPTPQRRTSPRRRSTGEQDRPTPLTTPTYATDDTDLRHSGAPVVPRCSEKSARPAGASSIDTAQDLAAEVMPTGTTERAAVHAAERGALVAELVAAYGAEPVASQLDAMRTAGTTVRYARELRAELTPRLDAAAAKHRRTAGAERAAALDAATAACDRCAGSGLLTITEGDRRIDVECSCRRVVAA